MTIAACPEAGAFPAPALARGSLLKKHLTASVWHALKDLSTDSGVSLHDCIRSGLSAPDSAIGVYAGDAESIERFGALFAPLIQELHPGFDAARGHNARLDTPHPVFIDPDPQGRTIRSTRLRLVRNLLGVRLMPTISEKELLALEQRAKEVFGRLTADLAGSYQTLGAAGNTGVACGLDWLPGFAAPDHFHQAAGIARAWPQGRGVFSNPHRTLQIWVNEEDHLRIISVQTGSDIQSVYARLLRVHEALTSMCDFQVSDTYGYLASCPSNLGTGLRASFHMDLPCSGRSQAFRELCASHDMELRSASGEGGQQSGTLYDISNKRRLGLSPVQCIQQLLAASAEIIALEQKASA